MTIIAGCVSTHSTEQPWEIVLRGKTDTLQADTAMAVPALKNKIIQLPVLEAAHVFKLHECGKPCFHSTVMARGEHLFMETGMYPAPSTSTQQIIIQVQGTYLPSGKYRRIMKGIFRSRNSFSAICTSYVLLSAQNCHENTTKIK